MMRQARRMAPRAVAAVMFTGPSVWWILVVLGNHLVANDGRVYRAAAGAWLAGHDPWSAVVNGYHPAAPPIAVMAFVPAALVPEDLFVPLWTGICFASALFIVRSLRLPGVWLIFPPLVFGVLLGNPAVPCLALALSGRWTLAATVRPQLGLAMLAERPRATVAVAAATALSLLVMPSYLPSIVEIARRYASETLVTTNAWGTWALVPVAIALVVAARRDLQGAAWVASSACLPILGWYGQTMLMPTRSLMVASLAGFPTPVGPVLAALLWCAMVILPVRNRAPARRSSADGSA